MNYTNLVLMFGLFYLPSIGLATPIIQSTSTGMSVINETSSGQSFIVDSDSYAVAKLSVGRMNHFGDDNTIFLELYGGEYDNLLLSEEITVTGDYAVLDISAIDFSPGSLYVLSWFNDTNILGARHGHGDPYAEGNRYSNQRSITTLDSDFVFSILHTPISGVPEPTAFSLLGLAIVTMILARKKTRYKL